MPNKATMRIAFRTDASLLIGTGHLMRCLALGQALRTLGADITFVMRDLGLDCATQLRAAGFAARQLPQPDAADTASVTEAGADAPAHAVWLGVQATRDAAEVIAALRDHSRWDWVIVDHYALDAHWHRPVAAALGARIAVIDDLADRELAADLLIDHNLAEPNHHQKYAGRLTAATALLGGPRFALLNSTYATAPRCKPSAAVRSIGIFLGGTDPAGLSATALRACREVACFHGPVELVTTRANPRHTELHALVQQWPDTRLTLDLPDLAAFFARHDLQVGAGGGANWERCCIGVPTLALIGAPNQLAVVPQLERLRAVAAVLSGAVPTAEAIGTALRALIDDAPRRTELAERSRALVDGRGSMRVAMRLAADQLCVRPATAGDSEFMHRWRNHPATRAVSRSTQDIAVGDHQRWLARTLADTQRLLLIGEVGGRPVGVIRFDRRGDHEAEVSLYLDPDLHGLGLGTALLREGEHAAAAWAARGSAGPLAFTATVLDDNMGSRRLFEAGGYLFSGRDGHKPVAAASSTCVENSAT